MEDVLDLYAAPPDPAHPLVCFDEYPYALQRTPRGTLLPTPGQVQREDYEYERGGRANLFAVFAPATGWRQVTATTQRTKQDFAEQMRVLAEEHFPDATTVRVVLDNLNTHTPAAFYEAFPPKQARRLVEKLEFHYTPKHGSWLNMVEIEWSILAHQCLARRLPDLGTLQQEVDTWAAARNATHATVQWRFTTPDARERLQRLYPETTDDPA